MVAVEGQSGTRASGGRPPSRALRRWANLAPGGGIVLALMAFGAAIATLTSMGDAPSGASMLVILVLGAFVVIVLAAIAYRLGVVLPRTLRDWDTAVAEREALTRLPETTNRP